MLDHRIKEVFLRIEKHPGFFSFVTAFVIAIHHGWNVFPNSVWIMSIVQSFPQLPQLDALAQYNFFSIGPYLAMHLAAIDNPQNMVMIFSIGLAILVCTMYQISRRNQEKKLIFVVFITSPIFLILLSWVGSYDLITVACVVIVMYSNRWELAFLAGIIVAWSNFEQFVMCLLLLALAFDFNLVFRKRNYLVSLAAAIVSYSTIRMFLISRGVEMTRFSGLVEWLGDPSYFSKTFSVLPLTLFSIFSSALILAYFWTKYCQPSFLAKARLILAAGVVLGLSLISLDQTRIGAIHIFPLCLVLSEKISLIAPAESIRKVQVLLVVTTLVFPAFFIWSSSIHYAGWANLSLQT